MLVVLGLQHTDTVRLLMVVKIVGLLTLIFNYHVVQEYSSTQHCMIYQRSSLLHNLAGPRTIANRDWSTPKALSTSFLAACCALVK